MPSGQTVFIGDEIKVGQQSRLQVMLLDETVFTINEKLNNFRLVLGYYNTETESNILKFNNDKTTKSLSVNYIKPF